MNNEQAPIKLSQIFPFLQRVEKRYGHKINQAEMALIKEYQSDITKRLTIRQPVIWEDQIWFFGSLNKRRKNGFELFPNLERLENWIATAKRFNKTYTDKTRQNTMRSRAKHPHIRLAHNIRSRVWQLVNCRDKKINYNKHLIKQIGWNKILLNLVRAKKDESDKLHGKNTVMDHIVPFAYFKNELVKPSGKPNWKIIKKLYKLENIRFVPASANFHKHKSITPEGEALLMKWGMKK
jgi:hypothetical protein